MYRNGEGMRHKFLKIEKIKNECKDIKTFYFQDKEFSKARAGNYVLVFVLNKEEIPLSVSDVNGNKFAITVKKVGETTEEFFKLKKWNFLLMRGLFGNSFKIKGKKILIVAGGIGVAPLNLLAKNLKKAKKEVYAIVGAKTKEELTLLQLKKYCKEILITTDDGTFGKKGFATNFLENFGKVDMIYSCGPEKMMKKVLEFALKNKIDAEFSLERYMHCGVGLCGLCAIDSYWICSDGTVFSDKQLKNVEEFGKLKRSKDCCLEGV